MSESPQIHSIREATLTVSASNSRENYGDYRCTGTDDQVEIQAAIDALPAIGGRVVLLEGTYIFTAAVSRAIDNIAIMGQGASTVLNYNGIDPIIDAGSQDGWIIANLATDAGGIDIESATNSSLLNIWINGSKVTIATVQPGVVRFPGQEIIRPREIRHPDPAAAEPIRIFDLLEILKLHNLRLVAGTEEFGVGIRTIVITRQWGDALFDIAGLADSDTIWTQPAGSTLLGIKMELVEQFAAAGLADMDVTVGDAGNNIGLLNPGAHNLFSDAVGSQYKVRGQYWDSPLGGAVEPSFGYTHAAKAWLAYSTAVGANMNTLTAGQIKVIITYLEI